MDASSSLIRWTLLNPFEPSDCCMFFFQVFKVSLFIWLWGIVWPSTTCNRDTVDWVPCWAKRRRSDSLHHRPTKIHQPNLWTEKLQLRMIWILIDLWSRWRKETFTNHPWKLTQNLRFKDLATSLNQSYGHLPWWKTLEPPSPSTSATASVRNLGWVWL